MVKNYYQVNESLATSGQPKEEEFNEIAQAGYEAIINLAVPSSEGAIASEGAIVTGLGLIYIHIPVPWQQPTLKDVELFFDVMNSLKARKVWVHCALNMRVSCFVYLYQKLVLKLPESQASYPMKEIWQPEAVWRELINQAENSFNN